MVEFFGMCVILLSGAHSSLWAIQASCYFFLEEALAPLPDPPITYAPQENLCGADTANLVSGGIESGFWACRYRVHVREQVKFKERRELPGLAVYVHDNLTIDESWIDSLSGQIIKHDVDFDCVAIKRVVNLGALHQVAQVSQSMKMLLEYRCRYTASGDADPAKGHLAEVALRGRRGFQGKHVLTIAAIGMTRRRPIIRVPCAIRVGFGIDNGSRTSPAVVVVRCTVRARMDKIGVSVR